jgi:EXPERA (EXPanded EBP superfamily)
MSLLNLENSNLTKLNLFQLVDYLDQYVKDFKDPLMGNGPVWFKSCLYLEVVFMVPFLAVGFFGALLGE